VWEQYEDRGVAFVGITYNDAQDASRAFIQQNGITYPNGVDERREISRDYGVTAVPETYVIDRQGRVVWFQIGEVQAGALSGQLESAIQ
jgi:cytochrome c biogenesis protein CcmG/thiol:disulfide interchange protein DsbE